MAEVSEQRTRVTAHIHGLTEKEEADFMSHRHNQLLPFAMSREETSFIWARGIIPGGGGDVPEAALEVDTVLGEYVNPPWGSLPLEV